jgi:hypothetical protein
MTTKDRFGAANLANAATLDLDPAETERLHDLAESAAVRLIMQYIDFMGERGFGAVSALGALTQISIILQRKFSPSAPITDYLRAFADAQDEAKGNPDNLSEATIKRLADLSLAISLATRRDGAGAGYIT